MRGHIQKEQKKRLFHRLQILQGQIKGLERAVLSEEYCVDILNLSSAIQESLKSFDTVMLENHLKTHVADQFKGKDTTRAIKELLKIYTYSRK